MVDGENGEDARDEMVRLIHQYVYTDRDYEAAAPSIINGAMRLTPNAALNVASLRDQLDWFKAEDLVDEDIAFETVVDTSYVETV
jgi:NitT/TauT family transport system substrate-binding protein